MSNETGQAVRPEDLEELSAKFIALRDKKEEIAARHKAELKPYNDALAKLESFFLDILQGAGLNSMSTDSATIYRGMHTSVTVADWSETLPYIIDNEKWELLNKAVNKTLVQEMAEEGDLVPGVTIRQEAYARVNRKSK